MNCIERIELNQAIARFNNLDSASRYADALHRVWADLKMKDDRQAFELFENQMRSLQILAHQTFSVADIIDFLKFRVGRDSAQTNWARDGIGRELVAELQGLRNDAKAIVAELSKNYPPDPDLERQVHLRLCREFLKHLAAHFEYLKTKERRES